MIMSYILEALKKSDRERKQGEIPGLQSDHALWPGHGQREGISPFWKWLLVSLLCLLSALLLYWAMQRDSIAMQEKISALEKSLVQLKEQPAPVAASPPAVLPSPALKEEVVSQPFVMETEDDKGVMSEKSQQAVVEEETVIKAVDIPRIVQRNGVAPPPKSVAQEVASETAETLPLFQELPPSVQKMLPQLKLAGHVYAKDATKRMIIINNRICREGDLVENQLYLDQILWEGVVLRYQDIRFRMNLL
jgi:general secretion pathway protein B